MLFKLHQNRTTTTRQIVLTLFIGFMSCAALAQNPTLSINKVTSDSVSVYFETNTGVVVVTPFSAAVIRVSATTSGKVDRSYSVDSIQYKTLFQIIDNDDVVLMKTDSIVVRISKSPFNIQYYLPNESSMLTENSSLFVTDSVLGFRFSLSPNEQIFGGGERAISLNHRGRKLQLYNQTHYSYEFGEENLNYSVPYFVSSKKYGIFFDNGASGYADIGKTTDSLFEIGAVAGNQTYFFLANTSYIELQKSFAKLVGTQPLPPRWAFGNMMSRFGYETEVDARNKVDSMLAAGYPVDAVILDLYWFGLGPKNWSMGDLDWYKPSWPNPSQMISDFKAKGVKTILITEPFVLESSKNFASADQNKVLALDSVGNTFIIEDFYFGKAGLIDIFKPEAQDWFWKFYKKQIDIGVAGWWGDLGEPERHPSEIVHSLGKADEVHNLYGHFWSKMLFEKYAQEYPHTRLFHLNRAGFAGSQKYCSFPWSGDVKRSWSGFQAQLPIMLGMSLANIPYSHSDLGGFCVNPRDEELYLRWLQFGVFNPIFRPHGEGVPSEAMYYGDSIQQILKPLFELRYRLIPYNYTLAWRQSTYGEPLASPLFVKYAIPQTLNENSDAYCWGNAFIVAPVTESGQKSKSIFLPSGVWFDFFSNERFLGNNFIRKNIDLNSLPVFVKAGSFIPLADAVKTTDKYSTAHLELHFYDDYSVSSSSYILYEDDGLTRNAFENKLYELVDFSMEKNKGTTTFRIENRGYEYVGRPQTRKIDLIIHNPKWLKSEVLVNGVKYPQNNIKNGELKITVVIPKNQSATIVIK